MPIEVYRTVSDASFTEGKKAGYAFVVRHLCASGFQPANRGSGKIEVSSSLEAEMYGILRALERVPDNSFGFAYCDVVGIENIIGGKSKMGRKLHELVRRIQLELSRTGMAVKHLPDADRGKDHRECHHMARHAMGAVKNGKRKQPKVKRKWIIRRVG